MKSPAPTQQILSHKVVRYQGDSHDAMPSIRKLRALCWPKIYADGYSLDDDFDSGALHWVVYVEGRAVGAARLTIHRGLNRFPNRHLFGHLYSAQISGPIAYISRLV
jgi:hypothetical protein